MRRQFIALDWGTTSFRAYLADSDGRVAGTASALEGILAVTDGDFDAALERHIGQWDASLPVIAAGMITSRQGWIELPYVACPAGPAKVAAALHRHTSQRGRRIAFVTGLSCRSASGIPDVMRGEETQVFGSLANGGGHFVTPGTHSKWIVAEAGKIVRFATYMTGEVYAALTNHTILGKLMQDGPQNEEAFAGGVRAALADPDGFLHRIFSTRSLGLFNEMVPQHLASYLSGQVIGTEIAHARAGNPQDADYVVLASQEIATRYVKAMAIAGLRARCGDPLCIVKGLARLAGEAGLIA